MKENLMHSRYAWPLLLALLVGAARHPTPTVVLIKQTDLIRSALGGGGANQFFVRKVTIGKDDLAKIQRDVDFSPEDPDVTFYLGKDAAGKLVGATLFPQVNTMHGPVEVGLTLKPDGSIASVAVTQATVETKPWVEEAVASGFLKRFQGMRYGDDLKRALGQSSGLGQMPSWEAQVITAAVHQGLVLHHMLFHEAAT
jgi:hypothetical protein